MGINQIEETTSVHQQPVDDAESPSALTAGGRDGAAARLEEMGYKQELTRNLGMISVLGLSFAIMAVPFGTSTTLNIALTDGGPVTILYGVSRSIVNLAEKPDLLWTVDLRVFSLLMYGFQSCRDVSVLLTTALSVAITNAFIAALFSLLLGVYIVSYISTGSC